MHKFSKVVVTIILLIIVSFCIQGFDIVNADSGIQYMPPNPDIYGDENPIDGSVHNRDIDPKSGDAGGPSYSLQKQTLTAGGTEKVIVIPIQFLDKTFDSGHTWTYFANMMDEMKDYYEKNSRYEEDLRGITVECTVAPIVTSSYNMSHYGRDTNTAAGQIDDYYDDIYELAREAVQKLELSGFDFGPYDTDKDGVVDHLFIVHAGDGQEGTGISTDIWSHQWAINGDNPGQLVDGVYADNYSCVPETGELGVFAHEFGHDLGLPDLYDTIELESGDDGFSVGVGDWDIMGHGSWNGQPAGSCPANLSAWSRVFLGWDTPQNIASNGTYDFTNQTGISNIYRVWTNGNTLANEYYLVEYRRQLGYDAALPGEGILVWHIDQEVINDLYQNNAINYYKYRLGVELEQADGDWDLWMPYNYGDDTDPFSDASGGNPHFTYMPYGLFNISNIDSHFSYVDMLNVDLSGSTARADFYITTSYPREQATLIGPADGAKTGLLPTFSWGPVAQAQSFVLQIADDAGFTTNLKSITITDENEVLSYSNGVYSYTWSGSPALSYNKTYYWRVVGINDSSTEGNREYSDTRTFTTYSDQCDLTAFSVPGQTGASTINTTNHTVSLTVPYGTAVDDLVATFSVSANATAMVGTTTQVSGTTHNNFNNPVTYRVTAENNITYKDWAVTVNNAPNTETDIDAFSVPGQTGDTMINKENHTVEITVPYGTTVNNLVVTFTLSHGATAKVGTMPQVSGTTANDFTTPVTYSITAEDGVTTQPWTVTVNITPPRIDNDITEFSVPGQTNATINDTNHTVAITVPYGTVVNNLVATFTLSGGATAKVGDTAQVSGTTSNNFTSPVTYTVTAEDGTGQAWVVTVTIAPNTENDILTFTIPNQIGESDINDETHTVDITVPYGTVVTNLVATFTLSAEATATVGTTTQVSGTTSNNFTSPVTYTVTAQNGTGQAWTVMVTIADPRIENNITEFSVPGQTNATINDTNHTVAITVPYGTVVNNLVATFTLSGGATAKVGDTAQVSGTTVNNFTNPVTYTVTAESGAVQAWTVTITIAPNTENDILTFSVPGQTGSAAINTTNHTVAITVPYGTEVDDLVATFSVSANATARVGTTTQVSGTTHNNFNNPVTYRVTAENGIEQAWTVTVTIAPNTENAILTFTVPGQIGESDIDDENHTVDIIVPYGTAVNNLVATLTLSPQATAKVGTVPQTSGTTANNFTSPVTYTVKAGDGTEQSWTVTVTIAKNTENDILTFMVPDQKGSATINDVNHTVAVTVYYDTDVTGLVATFTLSPQATATVGTTQQESGTTTNNFTNPVNYTVKAGDGNEQVWTVTVTVADASTETDITAYSMSEQSKAATINATNHTVAITVANGTDVTALVATFTLSDFATAKVSETPQVSGITANDFTNPVTYTVTGEDGTTTQDWVVTVTVASASSGGGGGGVGGGGSTFASASISGKDILISYEADGSTITLNLTKKIMNDLKDMGLLEDGLELDLSNISRAKELLLPSDTGIFDTESLTIIFPALEVELDQDTLTMLKEAADGGDIYIMAKVVASSVLTQAQKEQVGENPVYDVTVLAGGNQVSELGGELTVTIPYTLGEGDDPGNIVVWYLKDDGELVQMSCTYDEETESVSFVTDHLSYYAVVYSNEAAWNNPFSDVSDTAWYYDAVAYANQHGLFKGVSANTFDPNGSTTRAMVVTVLWRMAGEPAAGVSSFSDVNDEVWYADAVTWAAENGIVNGVGDGLFKPDANITREQLAVILYNYADFMEYEMSGDLDTNIPSYNDATNISQYAYSSLDWACGSGLIEGAAGKLDPKGQATRAQISAILMRFMENIAE